MPELVPNNIRPAESCCWCRHSVYEYDTHRYTCSEINGEYQSDYCDAPMIVCDKYEKMA